MTVATPSGLAPADVSRLPERRARRLLRWHLRVAGDDDGRPWWPLAVRRLPLAQRLDMAEDREYHDHWARGEQLRVEADPFYFVEGYGHVQPDVQGEPPIPFELWEAVEAAAERAVGARCQREVLEAFVRERIVFVLKARQLGLTWLALHFALWLMSRAPGVPRAKVLALSKTDADAQELLRRLRRINRLLPPHLRRAEARETSGSLSRFKLASRGEVRSLVSGPGAARMEQADLFLWDEAAFTRNGQYDDTWTAALPTIGDRGRAFVISTGNGSEDAPGDGRGFARMVGRAIAGEADMTGVFLPDDVHPDRSIEWRRRRRTRFPSDDKFEQEHPLTADQALAGQQGDKVYPLAGIAAAERLGRELDALLRAGRLRPPAKDDGTLDAGMDWGTYSALLPIWELEAGGAYVPPGAVASFAEEVSDKTREFVEAVGRLQAWAKGGAGGQAPLVDESRYDAAGVEQMRTYVKVVQSHPELRRRFATRRTSTGRHRVRAVPIKFGGQASGRGSRRTYKAETVEYLRWLFERTARDERWGVIAISPENAELLRQLRGLEYVPDGSGRVRKRDDHGPDALVAGVAPIAAANRGRLVPAEDLSERDEARAA